MAFENESLDELRRDSIINDLRSVKFYASQGLGFNITTDITNLTGAGSSPLGALRNPSNSGKVVVLWVGEFGVSQNAIFRRYRNSTINFSGTPKNGVNTSGGSTASELLFYPGGITPQYTVTTPGTVSKSAHIAAFQQYKTEIFGITRLFPGTSVDWTVTPSGGIGGGYTGSIYFEYYEIPLSQV